MGDGAALMLVGAVYALVLGMWAGLALRLLWVRRRRRASRAKRYGNFRR